MSLELCELFAVRKVPDDDAGVAATRREPPTVKRHQAPDGARVPLKLGDLFAVFEAPDDNGVIPSLDNNNILFLQANSSADRKAVTDPVGNLVSFNTTDTFDDGKTTTSAVYAAESVVIDGTETYKVLIQVTETASDSSDPVITYRTVNVDPLTMKLDWATYTSFNDPKVLEETFNEDTYEKLIKLDQIAFEEFC